MSLVSHIFKGVGRELDFNSSWGLGKDLEGNMAKEILWLSLENTTSHTVMITVSCIRPEIASVVYF